MSMKSYDSNVLSTIGLREPRALTARFVYRYYTPDESGEEVFLYKDPLEGDPRRIELDFIAPRFVGVITGKDSDYRELTQNLDKVHSTEDIPNMPNTYITVQDTGILGRSFESIERSCRIRGITGNPTDKALNLSYAVGGLVDPNVLQKLSVNYASSNTTYYNGGEEVDSEKYTLAQGLPVTALISDKVVADLCNAAEISNPSRAPISLGLISKYLEDRQKNERLSSPKISSTDFTSTLLPVSYFERLEGVKYSSPKITFVGYTVERIVEFSSGVRNSELIGTIPPGSNEVKFIDYNVRYGSRYSYTVRAVYSILLPEIIWGRFDSATSKVLIASPPSNISSVTAEERVPPETPTSAKFSYDYSKNLLMILWSEPVDRVKDVTRYQLFRRSSINEPFTLLKEFDFDQSVVKAERPDAPLEINVSRSNYPVRKAFDYDFGMSSNYIYALCAVDAHGFASNYSAQYSVSFNRRLNAIDVKCISPAGAPRPYPNIYLTTPESLTLDTITRSGVSGFTIVFDPEYLEIADRYGKDLGLLKYASSGAKYYVSLIDTARAEQIVVPINIEDLRST